MLTDIQGHWAGTLIASLEQEGKISGDGTGKFRPDAMMTRAEFAALLVRVFNLTETSNVVFSDVPETHWANLAIRRAFKAKYMRGYPNGSFKPDATITREEAISALASRGTGIETPNLTLLNRYIDASKISSFAKSAIARATQKGWILNYPNLEALNPKLQATRAEVAGMIRILTNPTFDSKYAVRNLTVNA
ncbi:S-layer homology domain-containing protein [Cyanobacteria bacterium FACHB-63]|nr:S-layer homology domain-containing protein [Cyanobacteria bacterium FACHB-63]